MCVDHDLNVKTSAKKQVNTIMYQVELKKEKMTSSKELMLCRS